MTSRVVFLAAVAAVLAMMVGLFAARLEGNPGISDTPVYRLYGEKLSGGEIPYRDFGVEYPPAALVPFVIAAFLSSTPTGYDTAFQTLMILALAAASVLIVLSLSASAPLCSSISRSSCSRPPGWPGASGDRSADRCRSRA